VFTDGGYPAAAALIERLWQERMMKPVRPLRDPKTMLQEWAQGRGLPTPAYREVERTGPHHNPEFRVAVDVANKPPARRENARRVDEDQLRSVLDGDPADQRARRLHLVRDDADLRTYQRVEQRRLAGVGRTDQSDKAAMRLALLRVRISHQACPPTRRHA